jgi:hypothetical protein
MVLNLTVQSKDGFNVDASYSLGFASENIKSTFINRDTGYTATSIVVYEETPGNIHNYGVSQSLATIMAGLVSAPQAEIDAIETSEALSSGGAYVPPTGTNYLDATTTGMAALVALDVAATPCTVAVLRTGTNNVYKVTAKTLADAGFTFAAATLVTLAGGTTGQLSLTTAGTQNGLTVTGTSTGSGLLISAAITTGISVSGACTTGISISGADSASLSIRGTLALTTGRAITSVTTIQNAALTDAYGVNEFDLTLTGTATGMNAATSSWVNIINGTATGMVCAQTNGIYEETAGTISGATIIFGMRMQSLCSDAPGESYPFSIVSNTNVVTALIQCNDASSDLGRITNAGVDNGLLIPLYKDNTGVKYVKIYHI